MYTRSLLAIWFLAFAISHGCFAHNITDAFELLALADVEAETCSELNKINIEVVRKSFYVNYFGEEADAQKFMALEERMRGELKKNPEGKDAIHYQTARRIVAAEIEKISERTFCGNLP